jgi:hypothetical protein
MADVMKALVRLGDKVRGSQTGQIEITPETIVQMISEIDELRRWAKHIQIEVDDLREKIG